MEIKANCRSDLNSARAHVYIILYGKHKPIKKILLRAAFCAAMLILGIVALVIREFDPFVCGALTLYIIYAVYWLIMSIRQYFTLPEKQYEARGNMKGILNEFVFYDDRMLTYSVTDGFRDETEINYGMFLSVYETGEYLFLRPTKISSFIVDKSTLNGGTMEELRNKLKSVLSDKYVICEY